MLNQMAALDRRKTWDGLLRKTKSANSQFNKTQRKCLPSLWSRRDISSNGTGDEGTDDEDVAFVSEDGAIVSVVSKVTGVAETGVTRRRGGWLIGNGLCD